MKNDKLLRTSPLRHRVLGGVPKGRSRRVSFGTPRKAGKLWRMVRRGFESMRRSASVMRCVENGMLLLHFKQDLLREVLRLFIFQFWSLRKNNTAVLFGQMRWVPSADVNGVDIGMRIIGTL
eukprot:symbB.v1.2.013863.t1/scaffold993.1/size146112/2